MRRITACVSLSVCAGLAAGQLVGIDFDNGAGSPSNWNVLTGNGPYAIGNLIDENGAATGISFTSSDANTFSTGINAGTIPQHTQSLNGLNDYAFGVGSFTGSFSGLSAGQAYYVWVFGLRGFAMGNDVTISGGGSDIFFNQDDNTIGNLWANGQVGDSNASLLSFAVVQTADSSGALTVTVVDDLNAGGTGWTVAGFAIQAVPTPGAGATLALAGILAARRRRD